MHHHGPLHSQPAQHLGQGRPRRQVGRQFQQAGVDTTSFFLSLGALSANDTIYVAVGPDGQPVALDGSGSSDIDGTIDKTAREAGELELVFQAPRRNNIRLLLAMDVGGSMEPYRHLVDLLFSAAHGARHFKRFEHVYFHNCIYEQVYCDAWFREAIPLHELLRLHDRETRLVLVGDAYMYPGELTHPTVFEVELSDLEAVTGPREAPQPVPHLVCVRQQHAVAFFPSAPNSATQLVQLCKSESFRMLNEHDGGIGNIDTHLNY